MNEPTVLLVDDSPEDILFFKRALRKAGFAWDLRVARDGQEAVEQMSASDSTPAHVLLDLKIPLKSGLEVLAWIRSHPRLADTRVIVLTSSDVPSDVERARALGVDAYLIKPLTTLDLIETIRTIADRWKLTSAATK